MASEKVQNFIEALAPQAIALGAEYNLDPMLILAQGALESGWGGSAAGNNVFGVKSHGQSGGQTILTHEEVNGKMVPIYDSFRVYDSPAASMRDYAQFLKDNPRYRDVFGRTGGSAIDAVANAGYATDSNYASKLKAIANMIDLSPYQGKSSAGAGAGALPIMSYAAQTRPAPTAATRAISNATQKPAQQPRGLFGTIAGFLPQNISMPQISPQMQKQIQSTFVGPMMKTVAGRTMLANMLLPSNIGPAPTITPGTTGPGTAAMSVSNSGINPVMLSSGSGGGYSPIHQGQNMDVYRANSAVLGGGNINQSNINSALSSGKTLYRLA